MNDSKIYLHPDKTKYERIVFISRLSAIGDVIIAGHSIVKFIKNGYYPILITSPLTKDIAHKIVGLRAFICFSKEQSPQYFLDGVEHSFQSFNEKIKNVQVNKKIFSLICKKLYVVKELMNL